MPEVNLGLIPGAGGTQRLPRLIGVEAALDMICSGKPISALAAEKIGIADRISSDDLETDAIHYAEEILLKNKPLKRIADMVVTAKADGIDSYRKKIAAKTRGFLAPDAAIRAIEAAALPIEEGLKVEREEFLKLLSSPQSKAQRHLFFAERAAGKIPGIDKSTPVKDIKQVGVIGGGIMGCGIAVNFLNKNIPVILLDISEEVCTKAKSTIENIYMSSVKKGRISEDQFDMRMNDLTVTNHYGDLNDTDLIIEAVFEDIDIKKDVVKKLDLIAKPGALLATNTSFLDVNEIASATSRPDDVIGLHFFSPAHIMPLLEIVRAEKSSRTAIATALKIGKLIGKTSVVSGVCYGFIANRMSSCYGREAGLLLLEGASVQQVDKTMFDFGMPMGMFSMLDMAGIDIGVMARGKMITGSYDENAFSVHAALVANGQKGKKTGSGFYNYHPETGAKSINPDVHLLTTRIADKLGIQRREISEAEIQERCVLALINEGFKIVEEGIALRLSDVDVVYALGFGFPRYLGGPLHYAQQLGYKKVLDKINNLAKQCGPRWWIPSDLLIKLAEENE